MKYLIPSVGESQSWSEPGAKQGGHRKFASSGVPHLRNRSLKAVAEEPA